MQKNLDQLGGLIHSQRVLLALTQTGMSREDAYRAVQRNAMKLWKNGGEFLDILTTDSEVLSNVSAEELAGIFESGINLQHIDQIFSRVFKGSTK